MGEIKQRNILAAIIETGFFYYLSEEGGAGIREGEEEWEEIKT